MTFAPSQHVRVVVSGGHLGLGLHGLEVCARCHHALEVGALLDLIYLMQVVAHVNRRELIDDILALDRILRQIVRVGVDLGRK